jgi:glutamine synthetase
MEAPSAGVEGVLRQARDRGVHFIMLQFTDILGITKNVAIPVERLEDALAGRITFDGSAIEGFVRIEESDMCLRPDPTTLVVYPWTQGAETTARLICDVYNPDGTPFEGCPRSALKNVMAEARQMGYTMMAGPEPEFFLFLLDHSGRPTIDTIDQASYFDLAPVDRGEEARRDMVLALQKMGFEIEAAHHEISPGQHEIDFRYADVLTTADNITTFRFVVKAIAREHDFHATFMPKPIYGINGSGMHTHQSLYRDGKNAFWDPAERRGLSKTCLQFIGGQMKHARGMTAVLNPLVNSYKRLVPGYEAPVYVTWSERNRSPLIRVPPARGESTRIELRSPDPSCNPYLAMAVMLKTGLDGIKNKIMPPEPLNRNIYSLTLRERQDMAVEALPQSLLEAIDAFKADFVVQEALGNHITERMIEAKEIEHDRYRTQVDRWEIEQYLTVF